MTNIVSILAPATGPFLAAQSMDPGTLGEASAQASGSLSVDPGTLASASAQASGSLSADPGTLAGASAQASDAMSLPGDVSGILSKPQPQFPLFPVLLAVALLALVLACAYILYLRGCIKRGNRDTNSDTAAHRKRGRNRNGAARSIHSLRVGKLHELGRRQYQQDAFGVSHEALMRDHGVLAVLADGMGGLADSERVSVTAVETILDRFSLAQGDTDPKVLLLQLVADARQEVNQVLGASELGKSGSTLVMGLIRGGMLYYLAVGDSRIYLLRDGALLQLSREHIYENELALLAVNGGHFEVKDAFSNLQRGALTSFLGMERLMAIDIPAAPVQLRPGDKVILMTDGVFNALEEDALVTQLLRAPEEAVEGLRSAIEACGYTNQDNYTAIILECRDDEPQQDNETKSAAIASL